MVADGLMTGTPYFMTNEAWYYHDDKEWKYKLTELGKSIPEVVKSYEEYYKDDGIDR